MTTFLDPLNLAAFELLPEPWKSPGIPIVNLMQWGLVRYHDLNPPGTNGLRMWEALRRFESLGEEDVIALLQGPVGGVRLDADDLLKSPDVKAAAALVITRLAAAVESSCWSPPLGEANWKVFEHGVYSIRRLSAHHLDICLDGWDGWPPARLPLANVMDFVRCHKARLADDADVQLQAEPVFLLDGDEVQISYWSETAFRLSLADVIEVVDMITADLEMRNLRWPIFWPALYGTRVSGWDEIKAPLTWD